jgi:soluble lytic murein transglycosylase-like protein
MTICHKAVLVSVLLALGAIPAFSDELAVLRNGFSIRHARHEQRDTVTRLYLSTGSYVEVPTEEIVNFETEETVSDASIAIAGPISNVPSNPNDETKESAKNLTGVIRAAGNRNGIDPDLIASIIRAESGFQANALSRKGAQGLMQLMPETAAHLKVNDPMDPVANVNGGTRYLVELLAQYDDDLIKALAAYNAGPERVRQYNGVPPYAETRAYVAKVVRNFNQKKLAQQKSQPAGHKAREAARNTESGTTSVSRKAPAQPQTSSL